MTSWMIVEDEPGIYQMLLAMSELLGNEGIAFVDGDEAIAWVDEVDAGRFEGELPELALLDIRLPTDVSGPMVGARLRKSPAVGQIGIVLMTAYHMKEEDAQMCIAEADADLMLSKPLPSMGDLQKKLADVVAKRAAMQPDKTSAAEAPPPEASAPTTAPATPSTGGPKTSAPETPSAAQKPLTPATPPATPKPPVQPSSPANPNPPATPPKPTT